MNLDKIVESYANFYVRFNIRYENEEPVFSILIPSKNSWKDFTTHPSNLGNLLEHQIKNLDGVPFHIYRATGTFKKGSIRLENGKIVGRNAENLERILEIPLDADYINYILYKKGIDSKKPENKNLIEEAGKNLHKLSDNDLSKYLDKQIPVIKGILAKAKIPYSEITRSGYGHYVKIFLSPKGQSRIQEIREFHKNLVSHLNEVAGFELFDRQCTDAGTRVVRVEGGYNLKNPKLPRPVYCIENNEGLYSINELKKLIPEINKKLYSETPTKSFEGKFPSNQIIEIIDPYYIKGNRQELTLSLTGFVAKHGGAFDDATLILEALGKQNSDEEFNQRIAALQLTFKKFKQGQPIKGYKGLEYILSTEDLKRLVRLFDKDRIRVVEQFEEKSYISERPSDIQFPQEAWDGLFDNYRHLVKPTTEAPESFHFGAIATILGVRLNRSVYMNYGGDLYPNLFTALIGRTGIEKKDTAINRARCFFSSDELIVEVIGTGSAEGLLQCYMKEETEIEGNKTRTYLRPVEGRTILFTEYEFSRFLSKSLQKGSNLLTTYTQLYDCPDEYSPPTRNNRIQTIRPSLSIITGSTLASCENYLNDEHVGSGFLNRFMFFVDQTDRVIPLPPKPDPQLTEDLKAKISKIVSWANLLEDKEIKISKEAEELWKEFYVEWQSKRKASNPLLVDMWSRTPNHIWKLAMLYAVTEKRNKISQNDLELSILIGDYLEKTSAIIVSHLAKSKTTKIEEYILNKLRAIFPLGMTKNQIHMHVGGKINVTALQRTLEGLKRMHLIAETEVKCKDGKRRPGYVAII